MSDPTPAPVPAPTPPPRTRNLVSQQDLADIKAARSTAQTAQNPAYAAALAAENLDPALAPALFDDTNTAEKISAPAIVKLDADKQLQTAAEAAAKDDLMAALRKIQGAVKRKFADSQPEKLPLYFIGKKNFGDVREQFEIDAQTMLDQAATDDLPGIAPAVLTADATLLAAWIKADDDQHAAEKKVADAMAAFRKLVASINARAREIKLAANSAFVYSDPENAAIRRAFGIPESQPYNG